jgi:hypothetical protein
MWVILIANPLTCLISFYDIYLFKQFFDIVILFDGVLGLALALLLLQINLKPVRLVLSGSVIMIFQVSPGNWSMLLI